MSGGPRKYAHDTDVPVDRSRAAGVATLVFLWTFEGHQYRARMRVALPSEQALVKTFARPNPTPAELQKRKEQRWRALHRVLLLTIRANLNAVDAGLSTAVEVFLPYLEMHDGRTVAEIAAPRLLLLTTGGNPLELT